MLKTKTLKRTLTFLLTLSMLLCCVGAIGGVQASAATDRVSMYYFEPVTYKYGILTSNIYIQVRDNASNQQVYVHYQYTPGEEWLDEQASYLTTLSDGSKIWKATISSPNTEYVIKYVADGTVIWDNNNGNNYHTEYLGTAPITVNRGEAPSSPKNYPINVTLQNYGFEKKVTVRYTEDDWKTYKDVTMSHTGTNSDGTEIWSTELNLDGSKINSFEYCVRYEVNGQVYWANNFGENYNYYYYVNN